MAEKIADIKDLYNQLFMCGAACVGEYTTRETLDSLYVKFLDIATKWRNDNINSRIQLNGKDIYVDTLTIGRPTIDENGKVWSHISINGEEYIPEEKDDTYEPIDLKKLWDEVGGGDDIDAVFNAYRETVTNYFKKRYVGKVINRAQVQDDATMLMYVARYVNESTRILNKKIKDLESQVEALQSLAQ